MTFAPFHDYPGLEYGLPKFHDFPGPVVTLKPLHHLAKTNYGLKMLKITQDQNKSWLFSSHIQERATCTLHRVKKKICSNGAFLKQFWNKTYLNRLMAVNYLLEKYTKKHIEYLNHVNHFMSLYSRIKMIQCGLRFIFIIATNAKATAHQN